LWGNKTNLDLGLRCVEFLAQETKLMENIVGIQFCNEAVANASGMYDWYDELHDAVQGIDNTVPGVISDGWNLDQAITYALSKNRITSGQMGPIVIDTHKYYCFDDVSARTRPQSIIAGEVPAALDSLRNKEGDVTASGAVQVLVGEYSCVLAEPCWALSNDADRPQLVKQFGLAQSKTWQQHAGGSYFWTFKMVYLPLPNGTSLVRD
jgi:hypothetical protein